MTRSHVALGWYEQVEYQLELTIESSSAVVALDWVVFERAGTAAPDLPEHAFQQNFLAVQLDSGPACELGAPRKLGSQHRKDGLNLRCSE